MIHFGTLKWETALALIAARLDPGMGGKVSLRPQEGGDGRCVVYFGGGHWRGSLVAEVNSDILRPWMGVNLLSREGFQHERLAIVEMGVAWLCHMEYR